MAKIQIDVTKAHRLLNAGPVTLITAQAKGRFNIHAAPWTMPVSLRPMLISVAIPPERLTHDLIKRSGEFVINVPPVDVARQVKKISEVSGHEIDKLEVTGLHLSEPRLVSVPMLRECVGHLECALADAYDLGDHTLFVGEVLAAWVEEGAFDDTWLLSVPELRPLHHLGGSLYAALDKPFRPGEKAHDAAGGEQGS